MKKILLIPFLLLLLTSCMTSYTINSKTEKTPVSLGIGGGYINHNNISGLGFGFNTDITFEFFESETSDKYMTFRFGPSFEYKNIILSIDFNVKYLKDQFSKKGHIRYKSVYNYMSIEIGYALFNYFCVGIDFNAKKELILFCRLLYIDKHI